MFFLAMRQLLKWLSCTYPGKTGEYRVGEPSLILQPLAQRQPQILR